MFDFFRTLHMIIMGKRGIVESCGLIAALPAFTLSIQSLEHALKYVQLFFVR